MTYPNYEIKYKIQYLQRCDQLTKYRIKNLNLNLTLNSILLQLNLKENLLINLNNIEKDEKENFLNHLNLFFFTTFGKPFFLNKKKQKVVTNITKKKKTNNLVTEIPELNVNIKILSTTIINSLIKLIRTQSLQIIILNNLKKKNNSFNKIDIKKNNQTFKLKVPFSIFSNYWPKLSSTKKEEQINSFKLYLNFKNLPVETLIKQKYQLINLLKDFQIL